jgi:hypothetical protein
MSHTGTAGLPGAPQPLSGAREEGKRLTKVATRRCQTLLSVVQGGLRGLNRVAEVGTNLGRENVPEPL